MPPGSVFAIPLYNDASRHFVCECDAIMGFVRWFRRLLGSRSQTRVSAEVGTKERTAPITGRLHHKRVYLFGVTPSGQLSTTCSYCGRSSQSVFSTCVDDAGAEHRCCMWCFRDRAAPGELERASKKSRYIRRVLLCIKALEKLRSEFPDPSRRPYGETSLLSEIETPFYGYSGIERVISKIMNSKWTAHDLARIKGGLPTE